MNKFLFFPGYTPTTDTAQTTLYKSYFYDELIFKLKKKYNAINIIPTPIASTTQSLSVLHKGQRQIAFDNFSEEKAFQLMANYDNYFSTILNQYNKSDSQIRALVSTFTLVNRDIGFDNTHAFFSEIIHVELIIKLEKHNTDDFFNIVEEIVSNIKDIKAKDEITKIYNNEQFANKKIKVVSTSDILKKHSTISAEAAFRLFCLNNEMIFLRDPYTKNAAGISLFNGIPTANNNKCTSILYYFSKIHNEPIELIKISSRPTGTVARDQQLAQDAIVYNKKIVNDVVYSNDTKQTIGITINFSNLMLVLLKKIHLAEVIESLWDDKFITFCDKRGIKIFDAASRKTK